MRITAMRSTRSTAPFAPRPADRTRNDAGAHLSPKACLRAGDPGHDPKQHFDQVKNLWGGVRTPDGR